MADTSGADKLRRPDAPPSLRIPRVCIRSAASCEKWEVSFFCAAGEIDERLQSARRRYEFSLSID